MQPKRTLIVILTALSGDKRRERERDRFQKKCTSGIDPEATKF
jgi:hypothetical protein